MIREAADSEAVLESAGVVSSTIGKLFFQVKEQWIKYRQDR